LSEIHRLSTGWRPVAIECAPYGANNNSKNINTNEEGYLAFDLGAESGRAMLGVLDGGRLN